MALAEVAGPGLFGVVLPVGCLVIGDAVLGAEVRSGTLHFTWLSPASFAAIVVGRWLAGLAVAAVALGVPFGLAALVAGVPGAVVPLVLAAVAGSAAYVALFVMIGALTRRAVVWSLGFVVLGERLLGTALSGLAQWSPGWEARAVYAKLGPSAADTLHRSGIPEGARRRRPARAHRRRRPDRGRATPRPPPPVRPLRRLSGGFRRSPCRRTAGCDSRGRVGLPEFSLGEGRGVLCGSWWLRT